MNNIRSIGAVGIAAYQAQLYRMEKLKAPQTPAISVAEVVRKDAAVEVSISQIAKDLYNLAKAGRIE